MRRREKSMSGILPLGATSITLKPGAFVEENDASDPVRLVGASRVQ
jgi:hypothetical protein